MPTVVHLTLWLAGGILARTGLTLHPAWTALALALLIAALLLAESHDRVIAIALPFGVSAGLLGALLAQLSIRERLDDCRASLQSDRTNVVTAVLLQEPVRNSAPVKLETVNGRKCHRNARVLLPRSAPRSPIRDPRSALSAGARVSMRAQWWPDPPLDRLDALTGVLNASTLTVLPGVDRVAGLRGRVVSDIRTLFGPQAPLAEALLVAQRDGIEPKVKRDFAASGLAHLLAISGTHVALVAAMVMLAAALLRLPALTGSALGAAAAVVYVLFLGAPYPAVRAALQILLVLAARLLQRPAYNFALLAAAGAAILLWDPLALLDAGFQLSFAGLLGIFAWRQPLIDALPDSLPLVLRDAVATSTAATLATTPIAAYHFGQVSLIAVPANLVAVPLVAVAVPAAALAVMLYPLAPALAGFAAEGTRLLLARLEQVATLAAATPGGHFYLARTSVLAACALACIAWSLRHSFRQVRNPLRYGALALLCACLIPVAAARYSSTNRHSMEIHAIDVGQGDAVAIRSPRGRWLLIDAGPRSDRYDAGAARVLPFLLRSGARELELMVLSHPHLDHIGGALAVARTLRPGYLIDPDSGRAAQGALDSIGLQVRRHWLPARPGLRLAIDSVSVEVLYPDAASLDGTRDPNDNSVILRVAYGRFAALFSGDAPAWVESDLTAQQGARLDADLIKAGHHGSSTSSGGEWLSATTPRYAIISAGRGNRYGHPAPDVLARLEQEKVEILRTDHSGTVSLRVYADGRVERIRP